MYLACFILATNLAAPGANLQAAEKSADQQRPRSGFIPDYSLLQKIEGVRDAQVYRYRRPDAVRSQYHSALIDPVVLHQVKPEGSLTADVLAQTRAALDQHIRAAVVSRGLNIVDKPGTGVIQISVALSGAEIETEGFKPRNLLPVSAVMKVASRAAGVDAKKPVFLVESKLVDSFSGNLVGAGMITLTGESFRKESGTAEAFMSLSRKVVETALQLANDPNPPKSD